MKAAAPLLVQILLAIFIAVITSPLFFGLRRRGIPAVIAFLIMIVALVVISVMVIVVISDAVAQFSRNVPAYQDRLQENVGSFLAWLEHHGIETPEQFVAEYLNTRNVMRIVTNSLSAISGLLGKAFIILLVTIFFLFEAAILPAKIRALPGMDDESYGRITEAVVNVRHYMSMKTSMSILTGLLVATMLSMAGVDYPIPLGLLAFLLNYVPNIGSFMAAIPGILLALVLYGPARALVVGICYVVINISVSNGIEPRVMGRGLGLSPVIIIISLIFWGWVLGPVGMLLSVPLTMTVKIALENDPDTRGIAVLLGSTPPARAP